LARLGRANSRHAPADRSKENALNKKRWEPAVLNIRELRGFGAFTVKQRNARIGRNPRTGEEVPVDEKAVPFFRTSKALHDRLNSGGKQRRT
jgi:hypothetical protein